MRNAKPKHSYFVKVLFWSAFLLIPFLIQITVANAAPETIVKVEPPICFAHVGETFTVNITVANVQNLYGIEIALYWNASILRIADTGVRLGKEDYPDGVLHKQVYENETFMEGKYLLYGLSTQPAPSFNGSGTIVRITFNVTGVGTCDLSLETKLASNIIPPGGITVEEITHKNVNGFFGPIQLNAYPKKITIGESVNMSGLIALPQGDVPVTIYYKLEEETEWHTLETTTKVQGNYFCIWTPNKSGKYSLKATAIILGNEETSPTISISVIEPQQPPWLYITVIIVVAVGATSMLLLAYRKRARRWLCSFNFS
jgi:hypothetical protein